MDLLTLYVATFGEEPPRTVTMGYESDTYQFLMMQALGENKPITPEDLDKALEDEKYDLVIEGERRFLKFKK